MYQNAIYSCLIVATNFISNINTPSSIDSAKYYQEHYGEFSQSAITRDSINIINAFGNNSLYNPISFSTKHKRIAVADYLSKQKR